MKLIKVYIFSLFFLLSDSVYATKISILEIRAPIWHEVLCQENVCINNNNILNKNIVYIFYEMNLIIIDVDKLRIPFEEYLLNSLKGTGLILLKNHSNLFKIGKKRKK